MRTYIYLITFIFFSINLRAQLVNPNFENWNTVTKDVVDTWITLGNVTKASPGQSGVSAAKVESFAQGMIVNQGILTLTSTFPDGYPYTAKIDTVKLWVKYNVVNMDTATIHVEQLNNATLVRAGARFITVGNIGTWTEISIPMQANDTSLSPLSILITITNTLDYAPQLLSFIMVDNIRCYYKGALQTSLPNNDFESWTTLSSQEIVGWTPSNELLQQFGIDSVNCQQTTSAQNGTYAVMAKTLNIFGNFFPGGLVSGIHRLDASLDPSAYPTIAVSERYLSLSGYLKFNKQGTDQGDASIYMFKNGLLVGQGHYLQAVTATNYIPFEAKIIYDVTFTGIPDSATIIFNTASDPKNATGNCVLWIDNIQLNKFYLGIKNRETKNEVYPNPFTNNLNIEISSDAAIASFLNLDGKEVLTQNITKGRNEISTADLSSGLYILKIISGENITTKKLVKM